MAAELSRKTPSRCIFFFSTLRAWSTLLSRTRTCMRRPFDRTVDGPGSGRTDAKSSGLLAHGYVGCGCRRHPRYEPTSILKSCLPMAPGLPIGRSEHFGTSPFLGSSRTS